MMTQLTGATGTRPRSGSDFAFGQNKKFQVSSVPKPIDLTLSSDDDDDDIEIVGIRHLKQPIKPKIYNDFPALLTANGASDVRLAGLHTKPHPVNKPASQDILTLDHLSPEQQFLFQKRKTELKAKNDKLAEIHLREQQDRQRQLAYLPQNQLKTQEQIFRENQLNDQQLRQQHLNNEQLLQQRRLRQLPQPPVQQAILFGGQYYADEEAVNVRERNLLNQIALIKESERTTANKIRSLPAVMSEKVQKKNRLLKLGLTPESSPILKQLMKDLHDLSIESRESHLKVSGHKAKLQKANQAYLTFVNVEKGQIIEQLRARRVIQEARINEARMQEARLYNAQRDVGRAVQQITNGWGNNVNDRPVFGGMLGMNHNNGNIVTVNDDYEIDDDNDDENDNFGWNRRFDTAEDPMTLLRRQRELAASMNLYSANATSDLRALLENVKESEEAAEGEEQTPDELTVNLLTHQRMGLHWLLKMEDSKNKGGILADDMGLGKTVQIMALMMAHRAKDDQDTLDEIEQPENDKDKDKEQQPDEQHNEKNKELALALEKEENDKIDKTKTRANDKDKQKEKNKEEKIEGKTNLIVCPVALINQWKAEIETKIKESAEVSVLIYHSMKRKISFEQLSRYDVVIVPFTTLAMEYKKHIHDVIPTKERRICHNMDRVNKKKDGKGYISPFYSSETNFYRVILDEAQWIKNKSTIASVACASIRGHYRWCLSGTPMQNGIDELFPLIRFLEIRPYCNEARFNFDINLPFKKNNFDDQDRERAMRKLRVLLRAILLRREKKSQINGKPILQLPEKTIIEDQVLFSAEKNEQSFYNSMEASSANKVRTLLDGPKAKGNYSSILTLLLRLRQACLHSELVRIGDRKKGIIYDNEGKISKASPTLDSMIEFSSKLKKDVIERVQNSENADVENRFECPICFDNPADEEWNIFYPCGHGLCSECVEDFFEKFREPTMNGVIAAKCTYCRSTIQRNQVISYDIFERICTKKQSKEVVKMVLEKELKEAKKEEDLSIDGLSLSPKFQYALKLIKEIINNNKDEKIILFSQFTSLFSLFIKFLRREDILPLLYVGSMNADTRNEQVKEFYRNPEQRLMLISLKAGNVGLTLTCANHVIIMDPFWNPYVEEQAQDRVYRIGQTRPVTIHRLLIKDTVEDRILQLQKKKKDLIESAISEEGRQHVQRLNRREIGFLFGLNNLDE